MKINLRKKNRVKDTVCDSRFHTDGELFAIATLTSRIELYKSGSVIKNICNHHNDSSIRKIRFDSNGKLISAARIVRIYDLQSQKSSKLKLSKNPDGCKDKIYSLATFGPNMVCAGTDLGAFQVWDTRQGRLPIFAAHDNHGYISDITGSIKKHLYLTSGDGYLTGYDMRKLKWMDTERTYFDTGFHCLKLSQDKKLIVGTESGSLYIFQRNNFQNLVTKMALAGDSGNRGERGINAIESLPDSQTFLAACTDGKLRSFSYVGNHYESLDIQPIDREEIESIHLNPKIQSQILCSGPTFVQILDYENVAEDNDVDGSDDHVSDSEDDGDDDSNNDSDSNHVKKKARSSEWRATDANSGRCDEKRIPIEHSEDYLNLF